MTIASYIPIFVYLTLILYITAAACYFIGSIRNEIIIRVAFVLALTGCFTNLLVLLMRFIISGRLPLNNGSEFLLSFAWITIVLYLIYEIKSKSKNAGGIVLFTAGLLIGSIIILMPSQLSSVKPLVPALKSPWLTIHVITAVIAYAGFALAAGIALMQIINKGTSGSAETTYRVVAISFAMLTLTIVFGAIWAEQVWGKYWSWDPKETWALITWIIYAVSLHLFRKQEWEGQTANIMIVAGFILVLFTYYGVNYLLSGLHSYGSL